MVMCPDRLPHILATYIIENNLAWAKEWSALRDSFNIDDENRVLPTD